MSEGFDKARAKCGPAPNQQVRLAAPEPPLGCSGHRTWIRCGAQFSKLLAWRSGRLPPPSCGHQPGARLAQAICSARRFRRRWTPQLAPCGCYVSSCGVASLTISVGVSLGWCLSPPRLVVRVALCVPHTLAPTPCFSDAAPCLALVVALLVCVPSGCAGRALRSSRLLPHLAALSAWRFACRLGAFLCLSLPPLRLSRFSVPCAWLPPCSRLLRPLWLRGSRVAFLTLAPPPCGSQRLALRLRVGRLSLSLLPAPLRFPACCLRGACAPTPAPAFCAPLSGPRPLPRAWSLHLLVGALPLLGSPLPLPLPVRLPACWLCGACAPTLAPALSAPASRPAPGCFTSWPAPCPFLAPLPLCRPEQRARSPEARGPRPGVRGSRPEA